MGGSSAAAGLELSVAQKKWFTAGSSSREAPKGRAEQERGGGATWDLCVWAVRKRQEGFAWCEGHRLCGSHLCTSVTDQAAKEVAVSMGMALGSCWAVLGRTLDTPRIGFLGAG